MAQGEDTSGLPVHDHSLFQSFLWLVLRGSLAGGAEEGRGGELVSTGCGVLWQAPCCPISGGAICTVSVQFMAHTRHALPGIGPLVRVCAALVYGEKLPRSLFGAPFSGFPISPHVL